MRRLLLSALSALLLATLTACEYSSAGGVRNPAPDGAPDIALKAPRRCTHCGWIESKREIGLEVADPHAPVLYEYTARMANGSIHVFRGEPSVPWRVGERLIVLPGAGAGS